MAALVTNIEQSRYGVILYDNVAAEQSFLSPLFGLVRTLNDRSRWVCLGLGGASNGAGAEQVLTWRTGYPRCVDFSQGFPRYNPRDFAAERLLERGEVDAAIVVCDDPEAHFSKAALARLRQIPTVLIDWKETIMWPDAAVAIRVAMPGVESGGTMFRLDGVPLALRRQSNRAIRRISKRYECWQMHCGRRTLSEPMPTTLLKIAGGTIYDPANGIDGQVRDLWIDGGRIVAAAQRSERSARRERSTPRAWSSCPAASICIAISSARK